jgi:glycosyltransferase involved in cell wall biosynthesis
LPVLTIVFLQDNHNHPGYSTSSLQSGGVGGTESSVIQLAGALSALGHRVYALNRGAPRSMDGGVHWLPLEDSASLPAADVAVGVNTSRVFSPVNARKKIAWLHTPPSLRQQVKRRTLLALLRHRPHAVLLSRYQSRLLPRWLPYSGRSIVHHGVGDDFFQARPDPAPRRPRAVFTSQPSRGLDFVAECWKIISAEVPGADLHVFCPQSKQEDAVRLCAHIPGIVVRGSVRRAQLAEELRAARVMLIPGVTDETFCLAAAEATVSGVPLVTLGIGALSERVKHGETGFIAADQGEFVSGAVRLLSDDAAWMKQNAACVSGGDYTTWTAKAREWEDLFRSVLQ